MSEGLYPPESRSLAIRLGRRRLYRSEEPTRTREIPDGPYPLLVMRARINLADLQRYIAAVKAGGTGEGVALSRALAAVEHSTALDPRNPGNCDALELGRR